MLRRNRTATRVLFTLNSIPTSFPKASFSFSFTTLNSFYFQNIIYSNSNKPISLLNNYSTFAERTDFYEESHVNSKHSQVEQNPFNPIHQQTNGFYRETQKPSVYAQNTNFGNNLIGPERSFYNGNLQKSNEVFQDLEQSRGNGYLNNQQVGSGWNDGRAYGGNIGGEFIQNRNECQSQVNTNLYYRAESGKSRQNINETYTGVFEESIKNKSGYQSQTLIHRESSVGHQHNPIGLQIGVDADANNELAEISAYAGTIEELDAFCKENKVKEALEVLEILEKKGLTVDLPRYVQLIQACGNIGVLQFAKFVHGHLTRSEGHIHQVYVNNKILEMYSNCGSMSDAHEVFENMPERNMTSWDTMITGFAKNGHGEDAIDLFTRFKEAGLKPDGQIFMGVFLACSVLCDIDEGMLHFESMSNLYGIVPAMDHYTSVVKMFGSMGYLDEAMEFIESMPVEPNVDIWETLMNLCGVHGNIELEKQCKEIVRNLDPSRLADKLKVKTSYHANVIQEKYGLQEVPNRVAFEFKAGDKSFRNEKELYALLRGVSAHMKEAGYLPFTRSVLHDVDEETKIEGLLSHSERLAIAHGLYNTSPRQTIRIIKNLRVCVDCHNFLKLISKVVGRLLIIRDAKRFHHFENGTCNCNDFW